MFIEDLTTYQYGIPFELAGVITVGWLDSAHLFNKGIVAADVIERLWHLIEIRTITFDLHANIVRGIHPCNICNREIYRPTPDGKRTMLGMSELWVPFLEKWFAAPTLIVHYIEEHEYRPPEIFIDAVMNVDTDKRIMVQEVFEQMCAPLMKDNR